MSNEGTSGGRRLTEEEVLRAVPPTTGSREFRVGVFVILGVIGFFIVLFLMTDPATFRQRYMVITQVDNAQGIRRGDPVQMRGVNIGRVHRFEMSDQGVVLTLEIEGEWAIPSDSRSELVANGLLGGLTIAVIPGTSNTPVQPLGEIPGRAVPGLFDSAGDITGDLSTVLGRVETLLSDSTVGGLGESVLALRDVLGDIRDVTEGQADQVRSLTASLNRSASNVEDITGSEDIRTALAQADSTLATLARTSARLEAATGSLDVILSRMEQGEGTLGQLSTNDSLYVSMTAAAESLRVLLDDVRENPGRYIKLEVF